MKQTIALLVAGILVLSGCSAKVANDEVEIGIAVKTLSTQKSSLERYVTISSKTNANKEIYVAPKVAGTVEKINFNIGDKVSKGDTLFVIDDTDISLQTRQAAAGYDTAVANYELNVGGSQQNQLNQMKTSLITAETQYNDASIALDRVNALYEVGGVSLSDKEKAETGVKMAKTQLDSTRASLELLENKIMAQSANVAKSSVNQAKASLDMAQRQLDFAKPKSEIDGIIGFSSLVEGGMVSPSSPAMSVVDMDTIKITFNVSDNIINQVVVGSTAHVYISALDGAEFSGTITKVAPVSDPKTLLFPVELYIDNPDHKIKPGMFANVRLVLEKKEDTLSLPLNAVIEKDNEVFVYVVSEENRAVKRLVTTGIRNEDSIEILDGISENEKVVIKGQEFLTDGSLVTENN